MHITVNRMEFIPREFPGRPLQGVEWGIVFADELRTFEETSDFIKHGRHAGARIVRTHPENPFRGKVIEPRHLDDPPEITWHSCGIIVESIQQKEGDYCPACGHKIDGGLNGKRCC